MGNWITVNKETFERIPFVGTCKNRIKEGFWKFLEDEGLLKTSKNADISSNVVVNELTKKLDKLLQSKKFKDFNPFLTKRTRQVPTLDKDGDEKISVAEGFQKTGENAKHPGPGGSAGNEDGEGIVFDDQGDKKGSSKTRHSRGIQIIPIEYKPDEETREAWVSQMHGGIVVNTGHPFYKKVESNPSLHDFNLVGILVDALVYFRSEQEDIDLKKALDESRKLLHAIWD